MWRAALLLPLILACSRHDGEDCPTPPPDDAAACEAFAGREAVCFCSKEAGEEIELDCANERADAFAKSEACGTAFDEWRECIAGLPCDADPFSDCAETRVAQQNECLF